MFQNDDFGPWGCKLDQLENDLSGVMHEKVHVASRRGIEQSSPPSPSGPHPGQRHSLFMNPDLDFLNVIRQAALAAVAHAGDRNGFRLKPTESPCPPSCTKSSSSARASSGCRQSFGRGTQNPVEANRRNA